MPRRSLRISLSILLAVLAVPGTVLAVPGSITSKGVTRIGTDGPDHLRGTSRDDKLYGRGGDDVLQGLAGNDVLVGGTGRDHLYGGSGNDTIYARDGEQDVVDCGPGTDTVIADRIDVVKSNCEIVKLPSNQTGTLKHPVPIGAPFDIGNGWRVKVIKAIPNANDRILAWDKSNTPPEKGHQFFMVYLQASLRGRHAKYLHAGFRFWSVGRAKVAYTTFNDSCGILPDPDLETTDRLVLPGGTVRGNICWSVRSSDAASLVMFNALGNHIYFALK